VSTAELTTSRASHPSTTFAVRICQAAINIVIVLLCMLLILASYRAFAHTHSLQSFGVLAVNGLFLGLFLTRRPAVAESQSLPVWILAVSAVAVPFLLRPGTPGGLTAVGNALQLAGVVMLLGGLLSLRRSFAVVPGNRGIRSGGMYRIVRHPLYLSELIALLGTVLANPTLPNWIILIVECGLQFARARAEEDFLSSDPVYRAYRARVRYRLIPGVV
jgi:protein-S-isoprenylcysteine O-methyltransferase Ste14